MQPYRYNRPDTPGHPLFENSRRLLRWIDHFTPEATAEIEAEIASGTGRCPTYLHNNFDSLVRSLANHKALGPTMAGKEPPVPVELAA